MAMLYHTLPASYGALEFGSNAMVSTTGMRADRTHIDEVFQDLKEAGASPTIFNLNNPHVFAIILDENLRAMWHVELGWGNFLGGLSTTTQAGSEYTFRFRHYIDKQIELAGEEDRYWAKCTLPGLTTGGALEVIRKATSKLASRYNTSMYEVQADEGGIEKLQERLASLRFARPWTGAVCAAQESVSAVLESRA